MIEGVADRLVDDARGFRRHQPALVLALELRLLDEDGDQRRAGHHHVVGGEHGRALGLANPFGMVAQAAQQRRAQPCLVGAAIGGGYGVAVGMDEATLVGEPGDRPFERAVAARLRDLAGEHRLGDERLAGGVLRERVLQTAGEVEHRLARQSALVVQRGIVPADLHASEEVGLGARHAEQARGLEDRFRSENLRVGLEAHPGAAPVQHPSDGDKSAGRKSAGERLAVERLPAGDLDLERL